MIWMFFKNVVEDQDEGVILAKEIAKNNVVLKS